MRCNTSPRRDLLDKSITTAWEGCTTILARRGRRLGREVADLRLRHAFEPIDADD